MFHCFKWDLVCGDSFPSDYKCSWDCTAWAGGAGGNGNNYCNDDWSKHAPKCVPTATGKIKDYCKRSCNTCGKQGCTYKIHIKKSVLNSTGDLCICYTKSIFKSCNSVNLMLFYSHLRTSFWLCERKCVLQGIFLWFN